MKRIVSVIYGLIAYLTFLITFLYLIGFEENLLVPKSLDSAPTESLSTALLINLALIGLFGLQHSGMARPGFKKWCLKTIPSHLERSTYVLMTCLMLILLFWQWRPLGGVVWEVKNITLTYILYSISALGWVIVFLSTVLINHFDLFGLRQVYLYFKSEKYQYLDFKIIGFYKYVRHPLMLGFLIAFWFTPKMTITHFIFALGMTAYIINAIHLEEKDLIDIYGDLYKKYQQQVSMLIPFLKTSLPES